MCVFPKSYKFKLIGTKWKDFILNLKNEEILVNLTVLTAYIYEHVSSTALTIELNFSLFVYLLQQFSNKYFFHYLARKEKFFDSLKNHHQNSKPPIKCKWFVNNLFVSTFRSTAFLRTVHHLICHLVLSDSPQPVPFFDLRLRWTIMDF